MNGHSQTHILIAERQAATRSALSGFLQGQPGLDVVGDLHQRLAADAVGQHQLGGCLEPEGVGLLAGGKSVLLDNVAPAVLADPKYAAAWDVYPFNSGYFMCIRLKKANAEELRVHLLDKYGVGLIAIGDDNLRVAFSCIDDADPYDIIIFL